MSGATQPEANADREMRIGILNAFQAFMERTYAIAEQCRTAVGETATANALETATNEANRALLGVLLAHPANRPAKGTR